MLGSTMSPRIKYHPVYSGPDDHVTTSRAYRRRTTFRSWLQFPFILVTILCLALVVRRADTVPYTDDLLTYAVPIAESDPYATHPIHTLMQKAKKEWDAKIARQSKSLEEAIEEYKRRYGRQPPSGFDQWYNWAVENNIQLIDEYDTIAKQVYPYLALSADTLRDRIKELEKNDPNYAVFYTGNATHESYWKGSDWRPDVTRPWPKLQQDLGGRLPSVAVPVFLHDGPALTLDAIGRNLYKDHARKGTLFDDSILRLGESDPAWSRFERTCELDSPYIRDKLGLLNQISPGGPAFVRDHEHAMSYCANPKVAQFHGAYLSNWWLSKLQPSFAMSRAYVNGDMVWPTPINYELNPDNEIPFQDKPEHKIVWRGSLDGVNVKPGLLWMQSHRFRLIQLTTSMDEKHNRTIRVTKRGWFGREYQEDVQYTLAELNRRYMNIRPTGQAMQCEPAQCAYINSAFSFVAKASLEEMSQNRYVMDVDGNAYSARFRTHLMGNQVVFKSTVYPEWYTGRIQPWLHYVPVSVDYSDLYDILAFFDGGEEPEREGNHDNLAQSIAEAGSKWANTFWRDVDTQAYMYRLLLEYARLFDTERVPVRETDYHYKF